MPWGISRRFHRLFPRNGQVAHALRTLAPVAINRTRKFSHAAPRLACVKPAASVHPEPGSNSSLYNNITLSLSLTLQFLQKNQRFSINCISSVLASCTVSVFSMNFIYQTWGPFSTPFFVWDCKGRHFSFTSKLFLNIFSPFYAKIISGYT